MQDSEIFDDMTESWMKVMDGLCPMKKSQNMNTLG